MSMRDLEHEPRWYRWLIYLLAAVFIGVTIYFGFVDAFIGTVKQ